MSVAPALIAGAQLVRAMIETPWQTTHSLPKTKPSLLGTAEPMSSGQTVRLVGQSQRRLAHQLVDAALDGAVFNIREATRTGEQNNLLWTRLSDLSRAKPEGRRLTADLWKAVMMNACGYAVQFESGIDGGPPFPIGFRSSRLTKKQMGELITFIEAYGSKHGVRWSDAPA